MAYKRPKSTIKRGTAIQVNVTAEFLTDEKLFVNYRKLLSYLSYIKKNNKTYKVKMKTRYLN